MGIDFKFAKYDEILKGFMRYISKKEKYYAIHSSLTNSHERKNKIHKEFMTIETCPLPHHLAPLRFCCLNSKWL